MKLDKPTYDLDTLARKHDVDIGMLEDQLKKGIKVELEHTNDRATAREIALDHLAEFPDYYDRLARAERNGSIKEAAFGHKATTRATYKKITDTLTAQGYKKLGAGVDATVWTKDSKTAIKIIMPRPYSAMSEASKTFFKFYNFCMRHQNIENLPRFVSMEGNQHHAKFKIDDKEFIMIAMEKLNKIPGGTFSEAIVWIMSDLVKTNKSWNSAYAEMIKPATWSLFTEMNYRDIITRLKNLDATTTRKLKIFYTIMLKLYTEGLVNRFSWDLHTNNVMMRADGTLVIIDPWIIN